MLGSAKHVGRVIVESLNVAGLRRNKHLSRAFHRAGISGFLRMLAYKSGWNGVAFEKADRWFASTKTCSGCGQKKVAMDLSEREYVCMGCGLVLDRDLNAARNLAQYVKGRRGKLCRVAKRTWRLCKPCSYRGRTDEASIGATTTFSRFCHIDFGRFWEILVGFKERNSQTNASLDSDFRQNDSGRASLRRTRKYRRSQCRRPVSINGFEKPLIPQEKTCVTYT